MDTNTRLQISYVALAVTLVIALADIGAALAHVSLGSGRVAQVMQVAGLLWAPAFYAVAFYRRRLEQERGG